ncbi:MAG TPA: hypothetical protein ENJ26_04030 [Rhodobacteraceae bacterium]|nr:hypothetical protein [Paracoccaceae bacterium]
MLQAEALTPTPTHAFSSGETRHSPNAALSVALAPRLLSMNYMAVEMDGRNLLRGPEDVAVAQFCEALRLADLRGKEELLVENIAPWVKVGHTDTSRVPIVQDKIERYIAAACRKIGRDIPVCRLDLRHGVFNIRCYLGRMKPSDFVHDEDLISDSR